MPSSKTHMPTHPNSPSSKSNTKMVLLKASVGGEKSNIMLERCHSDWTRNGFIDHRRMLRDTFVPISTFCKYKIRKQRRGRAQKKGQWAVTEESQEHSDPSPTCPVAKTSAQGVSRVESRLVSS